MAHHNMDLVPTNGQGDDGELYRRLIELEEFESLLEEIEERGIDPHEERPPNLPVSVKTQLEEHGFASVGALRARIAELHASIDSDFQKP